MSRVSFAFTASSATSFNDAASSAVAYADFKATTSAINFRGDVYINSYFQPGNGYLSTIRALSEDGFLSLECELYDSSTNPLPSSFATDFPLAIATTLIPNPVDGGFTGGKARLWGAGGSGPGASTYSDFLSITTARQMKGPMFFLDLPALASSPWGTAQFFAFGYDARMQDFYTFSIPNTGVVTPPSTFTTDFPGAVQWLSHASGAIA